MFLSLLSDWRLIAASAREDAHFANALVWRGHRKRKEAAIFGLDVPEPSQRGIDSLSAVSFFLTFRKQQTL